MMRLLFSSGLLLAQLREQILGMHWLGQDFEFVSLCASTLEQVGGGGLPGEQENLAAWKKSANIDGRFNPIHIGHDDVADYEVRVDVPGTFYGTRAGIYRGRVKSVLVEDNCEGVSDNPLVVNHKNFRLWLAIRHQVKPTVLDAPLGSNDAAFCLPLKAL